MKDKIKEIAAELENIVHMKPYLGRLSQYAAQSIREGKSNYPVANLMTYCADMGIKVKMKDTHTYDIFYVKTVQDIHNTIYLFMDRYEIGRQDIQRKAKINYTSPKRDGETGKATMDAPLSIRTLLIVCNFIHCKLIFDKIN